jgi:predicted nucleotidyltransferase
MSIAYPKVDQVLLDEILRRVLRAGDPERIVLFGFRSRGDARPDSDIDLLIIEESELPRFKRSPRCRCALVGGFPSKDIVVWTPDEVKRWANVPNAFISVALREGIVLYER